MTILAIGNRRERCAGFTLVELSIVVFIMAIIMAVSIPNFVRSYNAALLNSMGRTVMTSCQFAKLNAVLHQQKVAFYIDLDKQVISLMQYSEGDPTENADNAELTDQMLKTIPMSQRVGLASAQAGDQSPQQKGMVEATFYPNGTCDAFAVTFRGAEKGSGLTIMVDPVTCRGMPWAVKL